MAFAAQRIRAAALACALALPLGVAAQDASPFAALVSPSATERSTVRTGQVTARLLAYAPQGIAAGRPLWLGLQLQHAPGWHTYWRNPGDSGEPTRLQWTLPQGVRAAEPQWPTPLKLRVGDLATYGYDGSVLLPTLARLAPDFRAADGVLRVALDAQWLACRQECIPQQGHFEIALPAQAAALSEHGAAFEAARGTLPVALAATSRSQAASAPVQATVDAAAQRIRFETAALPPDWRGKPLNFYPATPGIVRNADEGVQGWQGPNWHITLPLDPLRSATAERFALVLALRGPLDAQGVLRNASDKSYSLEASVRGPWPAAAPRAQVSTELAAALAAMPAAAPPAAPAGSSLWLALGGALLGGLLLNLMPCVFPVLAIKVLSLTRHAHSLRAQRMSALAYAAGVVGSFVLLAAALIALRAGGAQLGWGFQLQNPYWLAALALLFGALGLNLAGLFHIGQLLPAAWMQASARHPVADALLSGALAVLVASPCTAPFMGAALGLALGMPALQALLVFAALGLGLALPVLAGAWFPALLRRLPTAGAWMQTFRQLMAFPMFAAVLWLVWVLGRQSGIDAAALLLALLLAGSGLLWALGLQGRSRWVLLGVFAALLLWLGVAYGRVLDAAAPQDAAPAASSSPWQPWSPQRLQQALDAGETVFVDYTAAWCITCQFNKQTVLHNAAFLQLMQQHRVLLLRADWTRGDAAITRALHALGRDGVPAYALHRAGASEPQLLPEILSLHAVQGALASTGQ